MLTYEAKEILRIGDAMFSQKRDVDSLWQEIALNFYTERADFTYARTLGDEFSDHLFSSYAPLARRELGNLIGANTRSRSSKWVSIHVDNEDLDDGDHERAFLEHLTEIQWRAMYATPSFVRSTKETDHDFATFGNAVLRYGPNIDRNGLFFKNYHLRDCAWSEDGEGKIDCLYRKWSPTARQLKHHFPKTISRDVQLACQKDPEKTFECYHAVLPARLYPYKTKFGKEFPFVSLYVERASETILEEVGLSYFCYIVPRWQTISNSVFGVSMATSILLPDGRTLQVIMRTLREAGEKYVDPPMIAVGDAIRGDMALYAGGVTQVDIQYDERLGDVLRPINQDRGGMPIGFEIATALKEDIRAGFFLDKIQLPESGKDMTAFEVSRRLQEHIRQSAPLFEPIIEDYNQPLCEGIFHVLGEMGYFPFDQMPESLQGQDIKFEFRSPLTDLAEQREAEVYGEVLQRIVAPAAQVDPAQMENVDLTVATRDAMRAAGWKAKWFKPVEAVEQRRVQIEEQAKMAAGMQAMEQAGGIAERSGKAMSQGGPALQELLNSGAAEQVMNEVAAQE